MFIDTTKITIKSGKGGDGAISFRREKYIPNGGPDGGDGGKGGDIIFIADPNMTTLLDFTYRRKYAAEDGVNGAGQKCYGKDGEKLFVKIPLGTIIRDEVTGKIMADLSIPGETYVAAKGGKGGKGNVKFTTPTRQAPNFAEPGMPGEERIILLELKLLADVGLLGFPNVGKSTLLSKVTKASPKIANYHFTTLNPNLGVVNIKGLPGFVIADIPGIIEGASEGIGLGLRFLKHIERTRVLIHIVDISGIEERDPFEDFLKINEELKKYSVKLTDRPQIIAANKADLLYDDDKFLEFKEKVNKLGFNRVYKISAASEDGIIELMKASAELLSTIPVTQLEISDDERFVPEEKRFTYKIENTNGEFAVSGTFVDRLLASVNVNDPDELRYFYKVLKNKGVVEELMQMGIKDGDTVKLNNFQFDFLY